METLLNNKFPCTAPNAFNGGNAIDCAIKVRLRFVVRIGYIAGPDGRIEFW